jgi:hypothetical protein
VEVEGFLIGEAGSDGGGEGGGEGGGKTAFFVRDVTGVVIVGFLDGELLTAGFGGDVAGVTTVGAFEGSTCDGEPGETGSTTARAPVFLSREE